MQIKKQQSKPDMEQQTGSRLENGYVKDIYCHPAYLTYTRSKSCEMLSLDEAQAGIKIAGRNINNLRYADDTTLMAESEEERKSLLMKVKEESETAGLKLNIQKTKVMASNAITSGQTEGEKVKVVTDFILGLQNHLYGNCNHEIKRHLLLGRKTMTNLNKILNPCSQSYGFSSSHVQM